MNKDKGKKDKKKKDKLKESMDGKVKGTTKAF